MNERGSSAGSSLGLAAARQAEQVCDHFEAAWQAGPPPRIEEFLDGWQGPERAALLRELVAVDIYHRHLRGVECRAEGFGLSGVGR